MSRRLIKKCREKRGDYITEACIIMPIFLMGSILLISVIPVIAVIENIVYSTADELQLEVVRSGISEKPSPLPAALLLRIKKENPNCRDFVITSYRCRYKEGEDEDRIKIRTKTFFYRQNILDGIVRIRFDATMLCRAFTGSIHHVEDEGRRVCIFPDEGEKYHSHECRYIRANCQRRIFSELVKKNYHSCPLCKSGGAKIGDPIFLFSSYGKAYHFKNCSSVNRYYVETSRKDAVEHGYNPCSVCGGE